MSTSDYGNMIRSQIDETDQEASEAKLVFAYGATLTKDGDQWCCLLGTNLQEGVAFFDRAPKWAVNKMLIYIQKGAY